MTKRVLIGMVLAALVVGFAWGQDAGERVLLRYKWNVGEQVTWNVSIEAEGDLLMTDLTKEPAEEQHMYMVRTMNMPIYQTVEAVDEEGNATVAYEIGILEVEVNVDDRPTQNVVIDPKANTMTVDGEKVPLPEAALGYFGAEFRVVMSPLGEVLEFDAPFAQEQLFDMGGISLSDFTQMSHASEIRVPVEPIREGYTWAQTKELRAPTTSQEGDAAEEETAEPAPLAMTGVYTLKGFETTDDVECAKIEIVGAMDIREPFTISSSTGGADLTVETGPAHISMHGFIYFDPEAGCIVKSEVDTIIDLHQTTQGQVQAGDTTHDVNTIMNIQGLVQRVTGTREREE